MASHQASNTTSTAPAAAPVDESINAFFELRSIPDVPEGAITYCANSDAAKAFFIPVRAWAEGRAVQDPTEPDKLRPVLAAFEHEFYMWDSMVKLGEDELAEMFAARLPFAIQRNQRIQRAINPILAAQGKRQFVIEDPIAVLEKRKRDCKLDKLYISPNMDEALIHAHSLGTNVDGYLDTSYDEEDIPGCSNDFCLKQRDTAGAAADLITVVTDRKGVKHVMVIIRRFPPGKAEIALPGGFKEGKELARQAAQREGDEETQYRSALRTDWYDLTTVTSHSWDPRALFAEVGIVNEGLLRHDYV